MNAGDASAASTKNNAYIDMSKTDKDGNGDPFDVNLTRRPDSLVMYLQYNQGKTNNEYYATVSAVITEGPYYQDPEDNNKNDKAVAKAKNNTIAATKPWVRLGISPFGIWRNKKNDPRGSDTDGLQCYDALYADCPLWTRRGWVDYMVPQLYWQLEHKRAPTLELMHWWNTQANGRHMYYGLDVNNMMDHRDIAADGGDTTRNNQLYHKLEIMQRLDSVHGLVWWPGYSITKNYKGVADSLQTTTQAIPALPAPYTWLDNVPPSPVTNLRLVTTKKGAKALTWQPTATTDPMQQAVRYVIYAWPAGDGHTATPESVWLITGETRVTLPATMQQYDFAVQAVDRCNNLSTPATLSLD